MQEIFLENSKFSVLSYLAVSHLLERKLTTKARLLYQELLRKVCFSKKDRVYVSYNCLEHTFKHSKSYFRAAFQELENKGYAYRETKHKTKDFYIKVILEKLNYDIEQEYQYIQEIEDITNNLTGGENGSTNTA